MLTARTARCSLALWLIPVFVHAADAPATFTLGKYVPEDCWMYVHGVHNPENDWLETKYSELFSELKNSGIDKDIKDFFTSVIPAEERAKIEETLNKVMTLVTSVRWGDLVAHEFVMAERIYEGVPGYEYILLTRGKAETAEANMAALVNILKEIAALAPRFKVENNTKDGVEIWLLPLKEPEGEIEYIVELFRKGDVIGLVLGGPSVPVIPAMVAGKSETKAIINNAKFKDSLAKIPPPEDSIAYFDIHSLLHNLDALINHAMKKADGQAKEEETKLIKQIVKRVFELVDILDVSITTEETDGHRSLTHTYAKFRNIDKPSPITQMVLERKSFEKFDQYIPAEATGFSLSTFLDLEILYKTIIEFVESIGPEGKQGIEQLKMGLATVGFDPQRDFFSWWSGEMISIDMPAAVVTPMSQADSVLMVRVKDPVIAAEKINSLVKMISGVAQGKGQSVMVKPVEVGATGFNEVVWAPMAMFFRPVLGVKDEWLIIGTSAGSVSKVMAVAAEKSPSIMANERFKKEGLIPKGPVMSVSFTDTSKWGQDTSAMLGSMGFISAMVTAGIPEDNPEAKNFKVFIQKTAGILSKLAPIVAKVDFYSSSSAMTTREGAVIRTETVTTYNQESMNKTRTVKNTGEK